MRVLHRVESGNKGDAWNAGDTVDNCIVTLVRTVVRLHFHPRNYYYQTKKQNGRNLCKRNNQRSVTLAAG